MCACRIPRPADPAAAARAEVIELLFAYVDRLHAHFEGVAKQHDLTPVQAKVLLHLDSPGPMGCVADSLGCDPSNITGVVDRLEERGLLQRGESPGDRRVKVLRATEMGKGLRERLVGELFRDTPGMSTLSGDEIASLRRSLALLVQPAGSEQTPAPQLMA